MDYSAENMPKSKEQWTELKNADPVLFGELTQQNVDRLFRENKELGEKNAILTTQTNNLSVELDGYKSAVRTDIPITENKSPVVTNSFSIHNFPKTKEQWEDLAIDDPTLHADLRFTYNQQIQNANKDFDSAQRAARLKVQTEHPDMYLPELDEAGQPKKDEKGKLVLKINPATGEPHFDPNSKKGKLWKAIYDEDPSIGNSKNAPMLLMATMERKLREEGQAIVDAAAIDDKGNQVVHDGVKPPVKVEGKYASEEEKVHVAKQIARGIYNDEAHFFAEKNKGNTGIYDENRTPIF